VGIGEDAAAVMMRGIFVERGVETLGFRLVTLNLNGLRSAHGKGFATWAAGLRADCMGVQEIKCQAEHVDGAFDVIDGMEGRFHFAAKKGYSGVGLYSRAAPTDVIVGLGQPEFDAEGRWVEMRFDRPAAHLSHPFERLSIISCYFPSGTSGAERQAVKYRFLATIHAHLMRLKGEREFILVGDVNIAHREIDLKNWRGNRKNSGFLPQEREWMTTLLAEGSLVDVFRTLNDTAGQYTWWSNRGQAWAKNVGWRIDYHLATPGVAALARTENIYLEQRFSDHAPLTIDYDFDL
jgi:exodeoxyribonuclease-3